MSGVQLDAVEAGLQRVLGRHAEGLDDSVDLAVEQRARRCRLARRARGGRSDRRPVALHSERLAAEMNELDDGDAALVVDRAHATAPRLDDLGPPRLLDVPSARRGLRRGHGAAADQHRRASGGEAPPVGVVARARQAVVDQPAGVRRGDQSVAQRDAAHRERFGGGAG